ncbi:MAG TPA: GEVED domain-containing protein [Thermoanaerobaculia bacterium]|nr:GEVED domain-containing protein [Thermoanaerobaculia bacterium]
MIRWSTGRFAHIQCRGLALCILVACGSALAVPTRAAAASGVVGGIDFGDAPDSYGTTLAGNGARHVLDPFNSLLFLGPCADAENDARTPLDGTGDDADAGVPLGSCDSGDDEDGVTFSGAPFVPCQSSQIGITASLAGQLDAWIDWNRDGDFLDAGEQIATNLAVPAGPSTLNVTAPCGASVGPSFARFRVSSAGGLSPTGSATDGEVEDYAVSTEQVDFGDAPDSYGTSLAANGATHAVAAGATLFLGACVDTEADAQAPLDGSGDDLAAGTPTGSCGSGDDEDGVVFSGAQFAACQPNQIGITASAGRLDAWIDWNRDGDFLDPGEQIATNLAVPAGPSTLNVSVPCSTSAGTSYARFRLSSAGGLGPTGPAADGEVEDYTVSVEEADFGDAPDSYGTALASNGPVHSVGGNPLYLGSCVDSESSAPTPLDGTGDDGTAGHFTTGTCATPGDDEDGVTIPPLKACNSADLSLVASDTERLDAWIDWNRDGDFNDLGERIATRLNLVPGVNTLSVAVPCTVAAGTSYARFRVSSNGVDGPDGPAGGGGEVEDYAVELLVIPTIEVPTLEPPGLATLAAFLALGAFAVLRRRRARG